MSALAPKLPHTLGRYTLLERIGGGGMATVFRATLSASGGFEKEVAVKVVRDELSVDPQFVELFLDEARLAARLNHANVVQTFDFGEVEGTYYLAMELVRGRTLSDLGKVLRARGLSLGAARSVHVAAEVAKGLGYAHRLADGEGRPFGLVHRDVSPQNVLVSREGEVKLADFGIAKAAMRSHVTQPGRVRGKCAYMAPEQARGQELDARADVFALGIVLWECLTGTSLFDGPSDAAILMQVVEKEIPPPSRLVPDLPPELDAVVMKLLRRNKDERVESGDAAARLLADLTLKLVRSQADIDLAELQRSLATGTAVSPAVPLTPPKEEPATTPGRARVRAAPEPEPEPAPEPEEVLDLRAQTRIPTPPGASQGAEPRTLAELEPVASGRTRTAEAERPRAPRRLVALLAGVALGSAALLAGAKLMGWGRADAPPAPVPGEGQGAPAPPIAEKVAEPTTPPPAAAASISAAPAPAPEPTSAASVAVAKAPPAEADAKPAVRPAAARKFALLVGSEVDGIAVLDFGGKPLTLEANVSSQKLDVSAEPHKLLFKPKDGGATCIVTVQPHPSGKVTVRFKRDGTASLILGATPTPLVCARR